LPQQYRRRSPQASVGSGRSPARANDDVVAVRWAVQNSRVVKSSKLRARVRVDTFGIGSPERAQGLGDQRRRNARRAPRARPSAALEAEPLPASSPLLRRAAAPAAPSYAPHKTRQRAIVVARSCLPHTLTPSETQDHVPAGQVKVRGNARPVPRTAATQFARLNAGPIDSRSAAGIPSAAGEILWHTARNPVLLERLGIAVLNGRIHVTDAERAQQPLVPDRDDESGRSSCAPNGASPSDWLASTTRRAQRPRACRDEREVDQRAAYSMHIGDTDDREPLLDGAQDRLGPALFRVASNRQDLGTRCGGCRATLRCVTGIPRPARESAAGAGSAGNGPPRRGRSSSPHHRDTLGVSTDQLAEQRVLVRHLRTSRRC
jgi:hypothetical protein